jgi:transcriptional regulator with XRE-family HTH domain
VSDSALWEAAMGLRALLRVLPIGRRIAVLMAAHGMNAEQVVERLAEQGVSATPSAVWRWESGLRRPRRATVQALEKVYDLPPGTLSEVSTATGEDAHPSGA